MTKQAEQVKHTATPYFMNVLDDGNVTIVNENGELIADMMKDQPCHIDELKANAEFIVKAVNNHASLVEALEAMIIDLENNGEHFGTDEKRIDFMKKALSQAKGE